MNNLHSILLHMDASPRSAVRLRLARALALQHAASVTALYAVTPSVLSIPFALGEGTAGALPLLDEIDTQRRVASKALFDSSQTPAPEATWTALRQAIPVIEGVATQALCADLMVLGQNDPDDPLAAGVPSDFVPSVLIASGKPAIIVPYAGEFPTLGHEVLVAWKPTRESARAVTGALPLLRRARRVHVVGWTESPDEPVAGPLDLAGYLRRHGIEPKLEYHSAAPTEVGEGLLSLAADVSADLLVMGCYGHSRARELVLGGASRTILRSMTLPVLMSH